MATRKPKHKKPDARLPGETGVARAYHDAPNETPPAALDAKILAAAHRAVAKPKTRGPVRSQWTVPLSTAAVVVLSLGVLLLLTKEGAFNQHEDYSAVPAEAGPQIARNIPQPPAELSESLARAETPAKATKL